MSDLTVIQLKVPALSTLNSGKCYSARTEDLSHHLAQEHKILFSPKPSPQNN